jgi:hypothetical protein
MRCKYSAKTKQASNDSSNNLHGGFFYRLQDMAVSEANSDNRERAYPKCQNVDADSAQVKLHCTQ